MRPDFVQFLKTLEDEGTSLGFKQSISIAQTETEAIFHLPGQRQHQAVVGIPKHGGNRRKKLFHQSTPSP